MNNVNEREHQLDLLVDGELDQAARRDLLICLDREADGWRCCAMAFLEAQSWRDELRHLASARPEAASQQSSPVRARLPFPLRGALQGRLTSMLAIAAGLLLAFTLGVEVQQRRLPGRTRPDRHAQRFAEGTSTPQRMPAASVIQPGGDLSTLASDQDTELLDTWTVGDTEAVPPDVLEALQRLGHRVERYQEFWPYNLQDGRRFVVPVERLEVRYVGDNYQ